MGGGKERVQNNSYRISRVKFRDLSFRKVAGEFSRHLAVQNTVQNVIIGFKTEMWIAPSLYILQTHHVPPSLSQSALFRITNCKIRFCTTLSSSKIEGRSPPRLRAKGRSSATISTSHLKHIKSSVHSVSYVDR